jgi:hypothetical protein
MDSYPLLLNGSGFRTSAGRLSLWTPAASIVLARLQGYGAEAFAEPITEAFDRVLANSDSIRLFFDAESLENYDSTLRTSLTDRFVRDRKRLSELHVLVRSKIVSMGVSVANMALGGMVVSHTERSTFSDAIDSALHAAGVVGFSARVLESPASSGPP